MLGTQISIGSQCKLSALVVGFGESLRIIPGLCQGCASGLQGHQGFKLPLTLVGSPWRSTANSGKDHNVLPPLMTKIQSFEKLIWVTLLCWLFLSCIKALCHLVMFLYPMHRQKLDTRLTQHAKSSEQREQEHHIIVLALIWKGQMPAVLASWRNCSSSHMLSWVPTENSLCFH